jgi:hypothetical protein
MSSSINHDEPIAMVRERAQDPARRTDCHSQRHQELHPAATSEAIAAAESGMGFALHPLHRRLLQDVADGGFGPGDGIVGVGPWGADARGRTLVELRAALWLDESTPLPSAHGLMLVVFQLVSGEVAMDMILGDTTNRWRIAGISTAPADSWRAGRRGVSLQPLGDGAAPRVGSQLHEVE